VTSNILPFGNRTRSIELAGKWEQPQNLIRSDNGLHRFGLQEELGSKVLVITSTGVVIFEIPTWNQLHRHSSDNLFGNTFAIEHLSNGHGGLGFDSS
jgi:hypothetical protein